MTTLRQVLDILSSHPILVDLITLADMHRIITLAVKIKNDILAAQPPDHETLVPPPSLPPHIALFLAKIMNIDAHLMNTLWEAIASTVWQKAQQLDMAAEQEAWQAGRPDSGDTLWPPLQQCTNPNCRNFLKQLVRERDGLRHVTLFTFTGPVRTFAAHLTCTACRTTYYPNYSVHQGTRLYYSHPLSVIQAAEHHYIAKPLVDLFIGMMLMSW
ncbi:hypothetical protein BD626DRAFT_353027, partial [Schizophyllum amplum]